MRSGGTKRDDDDDDDKNNINFLPIDSEVASLLQTPL